MQPGIKRVVAILTIVLVVVVGLAIVLGLSDKSTGEPVAVATTQPEATEAPQQTQAADTQEGAQEAQSDEAQGTVYEGALAGLTEEEIGQLAMAEEQSSARQDNSGAEDAVD